MSGTSHSRMCPVGTPDGAVYCHQTPAVTDSLQADDGEGVEVKVLSLDGVTSLQTVGSLEEEGWALVQQHLAFGMTILPVINFNIHYFLLQIVLKLTLLFYKTFKKKLKS